MLRIREKEFRERVRERDKEREILIEFSFIINILTVIKKWVDFN